MSIYDLIGSVMKSNAATINGKVASTFYEIEDAAGGYCWGCDVDIGESMTYTDKYGKQQSTTVLTNVPIAMNNREIFYAQVGWPVLLRKMTASRYAIVGLGKSIKLTTDYTYVSFKGGFRIVSREKRGYYYRLLTLGELGSVEPFGSLPLGAVGIFNAVDDSLIRVR